METLKIESVESNLKRELVSYLFSEEKTHKSENLIFQIRNQAYFSQIFSRETQDFHSKSNQIRNKTIFLLILVKET